MTDVKMTDAAAAKVREEFRDLSQEFSNSRMDVGTYAYAVFSACGEFGPTISEGTDTFELAYKETFDVCHTAAALIAGNTNTFKVELDRLDQDYGHLPTSEAAMTDHFTLDVDPEQLRTAAQRIGMLKDHLKTKSGKVSGVPGEIGNDWTGTAADSIKGEMTGLGHQMDGYAGKLDPVVTQLRSLAKDYQDAVDRLPGLNQKWEAAQTAYDTAVTAANNNLKNEKKTLQDQNDGKPVNRGITDDLDTARDNQVADAAHTLQTTRHNLEVDFGYMKMWLGQQTRTAGNALVSSAPIPVTPEQLQEWKNGKYPTDFDHKNLFADLKQTDLLQQQLLEEAKQKAEAAAKADADELLGYVKDGMDDPEAMKKLMAEMGSKANDPLYAKALVDYLGPEGFNRVYEGAEFDIIQGQADEESDWKDAISAFNDVFAAGLAQYSNPDLAKFQGSFMNNEHAARLVALSGSDYADNRLTGLAFSVSWYADPNMYGGDFDNVDLGRFMMYEEYPEGYEEMVKNLAANTDKVTFSELLNDADQQDRERIVREIMNAHMGPGAPGQTPINYEKFDQNNAAFLRALLDQSVKGAGYPEVVETVLKYRGENQYDENFEAMLHLDKFLGDVDTITYFADHGVDIDGKVIADAANDYLDEDTVKSLLDQIVEQGGPTQNGGIKVAQRLGYLLGLADTADVDIDWGKALQPIIDKAISTLVEAGAKKVPGLDVVVDILKGLGEQAAEAEQRREDFGNGWSDEHEHQVLSWVLYLQEHGVPDGYSDWLAANQSHISESEPDAAVTQYITYLGQQPPDSKEYKTYLGLEQLQEQINESRRIGQ